jgi:eukaryotic-like serine/threonine-protein kinase
VEEHTVFEPSSGALPAGVRLNGIYEIERLIGRGCVSEVHKGFNIQTRDAVAVKMLRAEISGDANMLACFRQEASILLQMQHEALVRHFVFSVDPTLGRAYLAMEYVEGISLAARLAPRPLSLADAGLLRRRIAGALEAAHRLGVVHGDIRPDNLIQPDADVGRTKIVDFGIAQKRAASERTLFVEGPAAKRNYYSSEQLSGGGDFKSDIYSFGLVLAEAVLGRPFDMGGSIVEMIGKRLAMPDLTEVPPGIRPLLQAMLQPDPADRPASMAAVADWSEAPLAGTARNPRALNYTRPAPTPRDSRRRVSINVLAALVAIATVAAAAYFYIDDVDRLARGLIAAGCQSTAPEQPRPAPRVAMREPDAPTATETPAPVVRTPAPTRSTVTATPAPPPPSGSSAPTSLSVPETRLVAPPSATEAPLAPGATETPSPNASTPPAATENPTAVPPAIP